MTARVLRKGLIRRILIFGFVWAVLTGGALDSWLIGIPSILLALFVNAYLPPLSSFKISPKGAIFFLFYFATHSFLAGVDVVKRAVQPKIPLDPGLMEYQVRLTSEFAVILFLNTISLFPGTFSLRLSHGHILVHVLDQSEPAFEKLRRLEGKIGEMFCENLR